MKTRQFSVIPAYYYAIRVRIGRKSGVTSRKMRETESVVALWKEYRVRIFISILIKMYYGKFVWIDYIYFDFSFELRFPHK